MVVEKKLILMFFAIFSNHGCHLSSTSKFPDFSPIFPDILQFSIPSDR